MSDKKENLTEEDYLKRHLGDMETGKKNNNTFVSDTTFNDNVVENVGRVDDLQYFNCDIRELPCGRFYPSGTLFMVRPAKVYPDGKVGSFLEVKDQDRLFLIFLIRELTFQQGNSLKVDSKCTCGNDVSLELTRKNFHFHEIDEKLERFFNPSTRCYHFETKNGGVFEVTPPNIGLQKAFTDYIIKENNEKVSPNLSFLKIIPFMLGSRTSITYDGIKSKLVEFEKMDDQSFQFLNAAVGKMTFGIKELKKTCECGAEVHAEMQFPNGTSSIFVIHDAFEAYIKE
jgi:hypothetical protein